MADTQERVLLIETVPEQARILNLGQTLHQLL